MKVDDRIARGNINSNMEKRLFFASLFLSLLVHVIIIGILSFVGLKNNRPYKPKKSIEITYRDLKQLQKESKPMVSKDVKVVKDMEPQEKEKVKVLTRKDNIFSAFGGQIKDISKLSGKLPITREKTTKINTLDIGQKITLSPFTSEKITNPQYLTYNDDMRAMISRNIKQKAYTYVNNADFEAGEVYVTFILDSTGHLEKVKIIEEKTSANSYLRNVAVRSIMESNPFPPFPRGFDYPEFTFNLLITFQD